MKIRATGVAVVSAVVLAACASATSGPITNGTGGHTTTVTVSHSASSSGSGHGGSTTTTTAADPCSSPASLADCGSCANQTDCSMCAGTIDMSGVMAYNALANCIFCTACYTSCNGASENCMSAPTTKDACDVGTAGMTACDTCQMCSAKATCMTALATCEGNTACKDLLMNLSSTCGSLPM